ncbi:MAG TPA: SIMPL domain-containing protein [Longimicrobiaceae bacterium]|nr:SIMPL domain-containing protein [Longimicrobiaceae bacterium]
MRKLRTRTWFVAVAAVLGTGVAAPATAQVAGGVQYEGRTIRVSGSGEYRAQPNLATAQFGVETSAPTAEAAATQNAERMDRVLQALLRAGVQRADIQTSGYSLYPQYTQDRRVDADAEPRISGYRAVNQISVRTRDLPAVGGLIDVSLAAGANRLHGVFFQLEDEAAEAAEAQALTRAVADARRSAETIARALGVQLGSVLDASTATQPMQPMYRVRQESMDIVSMAAPPPTPIEPGQQTVTATASLVFAIQ